MNLLISSKSTFAAMEDSFPESGICFVFTALRLYGGKSRIRYQQKAGPVKEFGRRDISFIFL